MRKQGRIHYILMAPALLFCAVFVLWPIVDLLWLSVHKTDFIQTKFVGLGNYVKALESNQFWQAIGNSALYIVLITVGQVGLAIIVALSVMSMKKRWIDFTRIASYLPALTAGVIIAMVWRWVFHYEGPANWFIGLFGAQPVQWFAGELSIPIVSLIVIISGFGGYLIMTLAAIQSISKELFDAARIDGASELHIKLRIVLPILRPSIGMMVLLTAISAPQIIETVMMLAPYDHSASAAFAIYKEAFQNGRHGLAAAMAVIVTIVLIGFTLIKGKVEKYDS